MRERTKRIVLCCTGLCFFSFSPFRAVLAGPREREKDLD